MMSIDSCSNMKRTATGAYESSRSTECAAVRVVEERLGARATTMLAVLPAELAPCANLCECMRRNILAVDVCRAIVGRARWSQDAEESRRSALRQQLRDVMSRVPEIALAGEKFAESTPDMIATLLASPAVLLNRYAAPQPCHQPPPCAATSHRLAAAPECMQLARSTATAS